MSQNKRKRGARFALSMLGCCNGSPREEKPGKKASKSCMQHVNSASNTACSCADESEGSTLSSYAYIPSAEYLNRRIEVPLIHRYTGRLMSPDPPEDKSMVYQYIAKPKSSEHKSVMTAYEKHMHEMEMRDLNENLVSNKQVKGKNGKIGPSELCDTVQQHNPSISSNNSSRMFQRFHQGVENRSVDSIRNIVLEEHSGWQMSSTNTNRTEEILENEDVDLPDSLFHDTDDLEDYEESRQSRKAVLRHLAGKRKK